MTALFAFFVGSSFSHGLGIWTTNSSYQEQ